MSARRAALAVTLVTVLAVPLISGLGGVASAQQGIPSSVALVHLEKRIFKTGDWVLYKVEGRNETGETSVDYQRIQIGSELTYRGEQCFWLETGWGTDLERLAWGGTMVSENIFADSLADVRGNLHMRLLHVSYADDGTPLAVPVRARDPGQTPAELAALRPVVTEIGIDTLDTPKGRIPCRLVEARRTFRTSRDMADSTQQKGNVSVARRWYNTDLVPITGLVREEEEKTYFTRTWPLGRPSTDYPMVEVGRNVIHASLLDCGHGAKPKIADRVRVTTTVEAEGAPIE